MNLSTNLARWHRQCWRWCFLQGGRVNTIRENVGGSLFAIKYVSSLINQCFH